MNQKYHVQYIFSFLDIPSRHYIISALKDCVELIVNFLPIYILLGVLFQYFKIWLISHDSVTTQSFENGRVDSAYFFTESTQSLTLTLTASITILLSLIVSKILSASFLALFAIFLSVSSSFSCI